MKANYEVLYGEVVESVDILRAELAHVAAKIEEELGKLDRELASDRQAFEKCAGTLRLVVDSLAPSDMGETLHARVVETLDDLTKRLDR